MELTRSRAGKAFVMVLALLGSLLVTTISAPAAQAATARNGVCESGEICFYYNSNNAGSISDHAATDLGNYGTDPASCYVFRTAGRNGYNQCIKNNVASVWNRTGKTVRVHYNSYYGGRYDAVAAGAKRNLSAALKNENASHDVKPFRSSAGCKNSFGNPRTCAGAVSWAKGKIGATGWGGLCDRFVANAYGWSNSGSHTAYIHWTQIPSTHKHGGDRSVPAGGLAFFSGGSSGAGHVMISIGGGEFVSNDIDGYNRISKATIAEVESEWGQRYLGWAQPWFKVNH
ncbi:peptidase inhibitor family I36 protein [Myceligenerans salitolerans]|uniref:Peptidase inhibitor family I36 protein n=1 Tax=Myceligenerans salitolerans TaxID=1230528 RepID=A0ABS3IBY3_9MICO|nr:peptidase inhibitor family I36 protein [Myceligenerans salitolerans]MBO0610542.1 peptidase inhibitor family I36 protein [Myceligenerans salitolerans]